MLFPGGASGLMGKGLPGTRRLRGFGKAGGALDERDRAAACHKDRCGGRKGREDGCADEPGTAGGSHFRGSFEGVFHAVQPKAWQ